MEEHLLEKLKSRAAASGTTVSALIEEAVKILLNRQPLPSGQRTFELVTFGAGGKFSRYNVDKTSELLAADDRERYGEAD